MPAVFLLRVLGVYYVYTCMCICIGIYTGIYTGTWGGVVWCGPQAALCRGRVVAGAWACGAWVCLCRRTLWKCRAMCCHASQHTASLRTRVGHLHPACACSCGHHSQLHWAGFYWLGCLGFLCMLTHSCCMCALMFVQMAMNLFGPLSHTPPLYPDDDPMEVIYVTTLITAPDGTPANEVCVREGLV